MISNFKLFSSIFNLNRGGGNQQGQARGRARNRGPNRAQNQAGQGARRGRSRTRRGGANNSRGIFRLKLKVGNFKDAGWLQVS